MSAKKNGNGSWGFVILFSLIICLGGYKIWDHWFNHDGAYTDYASAGAHVREQILKHDEKAYVSFNTDSYNRFLGQNECLTKIYKEAFAHTGDPRCGDHLAMNVWPKETRTVAVDMPGDTKNLNMTTVLEYSLTREQEEELQKAAQRIIQGLNLNGKSDYEKARAIYGYICSHVVYDYEHLDNLEFGIYTSAYGAAIKGTAVCAGVADLFYYLANSAGLDARIETNQTHAWNFVGIDGTYYYVDATWDLGKSEADWDYFLKGITDFEEHKAVFTLDKVGDTLVHSHLGYDIAGSGYQAGA